MTKITDDTLYSLAVSDLAKYDLRRRGGYKNQIIAERNAIGMRWGGVRELRKMIAEYEAREIPVVTQYVIQWRPRKPLDGPWQHWSTVPDATDLRDVEAQVWDLRASCGSDREFRVDVR